MALAGLTWEICLAYLDDLIIFSRTFDQQLERLQKVFDSLVQAGLKLKPSKCAFFQKKVKFLGSVVSSEGIEPDPEKVQAVAQWQTPCLIIREGILYRKFVKPDGSLQYWQIIVPNSLRVAFLDAVYSGAWNGHPGIERTRLKLQE